jgi:hypothetical protein
MLINPLTTIYLKMTLMVIIPVLDSYAEAGVRCTRSGRPDWSLAMPSAQELDTHHKALTLNLDASAFGSFAEIGAGQEVAYWFFLEVSRPHYELGSVQIDVAKSSSHRSCT